MDEQKRPEISLVDLIETERNALGSNLVRIRMQYDYYYYYVNTTWTNKPSSDLCLLSSIPCAILKFYVAPVHWSVNILKNNTGNVSNLCMQDTFVTILELFWINYLHVMRMNNTTIYFHRQESHWSRFWHGRNEKFKIKKTNWLRRKIRKNGITNLANSSVSLAEKCSGIYNI